MAWRIFLPSCRIPGHLPSLSSPFSTSFLKTKIPKHLRRRRRRPPSPRTTPIQPSPATSLPHLEDILLRDARFRFLTRTFHFLSSLPPPHLLPLPPSASRHGSLYRDLGFPRGRNPLRFAGLHPLLFSTPLIGNRVHLGLTPLALALLKERDGIMDAAESDHVTKVRKLLMMSASKRIALNKLYHCRAVFGLPDDFRDRARKYPEYFRVVTDGEGRKVLELVCWDAKLSVTEIEKQFMVNEERVRRKFSFPVKYSRHMGLPEEDRMRVNAANTLPLISPYSGWGGEEGDEMSSLEAEKYRVGLLHEFLSLTLEKRASIHHIMEFKEEFRLTRRTYETLRKQPRCFYLAGTEMNWAVFLREGYDKEGKLRNKDHPLLTFNEKLYRYAEKKSLEEAEEGVEVAVG
ncbi:hypothetical protein MLD38_001034 [Melastoma candidum]|uniref:Uncharacterized protein n=1 Tax=Melastoma candidum TaxID=119954 RepID=A0ACB9SFW0_9MYRT|nr:hypothetical protein MLD38_001034 [Melastoma candidum]